MSPLLGGAVCCVLMALLVGAAGVMVWMTRRGAAPPPLQLTSEDVIHAELAYTFALMIRGAAPVGLPELDVADAGVLAAVDAHMAAGRHEAALKMVDARMGTAGPALSAHLLDRRGAACLERGDWAGAERAFTALAEAAPTEAARLGPLAVVRARQGRYRDLLALAATWEGLGGTPESRSRYNDLKRALDAITS